MLDRRRIALTLVCAIAGLVCNLVKVPLPFEGGAELGLGDAFPLVAAGLAGPVAGALAAAVAALPYAMFPPLFAAHVLASAVVGWAVRRGEFVLPVNVAFWATGGAALATLAAGDVWEEGPFLVLASALVTGAVADAAIAAPLLGPRLGETGIRRGIAAHLWMALAFASVAPCVALGLWVGPGSHWPALLTAAAASIVAFAGSRALGSRFADALEAPDRSAPNPYVEIAEIAEARERAAIAVEAAGEQARELRHRLAERETAYGQLLALSERLEERLELRGAELEERNFSLSLAERHYREAVELATEIVFTLDLEGRFTAVNAAGERFFGHSQTYLVGRHWRRTLAPGFDHVDGAEGEQSLLERLYHSSPRMLTTVHSAAHDEMRILTTRMDLVRDEDGLPLNVRCVARDVTEIEHFQQQVRDLGTRLEHSHRVVQRRERELNALLSAARVINSELEIDQLLQHIIESAAAQIQAESGFVGLLDEGALTLSWYWRSSGAAWFDQHGPRVEHGVTQVVMRTKRPYLCTDAATDSNTDKEFTDRFGVRTMLAVPIFDQSSELLGAMALHNFPLPGAGGDAVIDPSDMRFLEGLSDIAAAAIQQSKLLERVRHQAETDPLSGLFNRRAFETRFDEELHRATRFGRSFSLVLIDIDHLKKINDTYGHPIGDAAICTVADVLQSRLRRHDFAARIGGEEFAALIVEAKPEQAAVAARNLCDAIRKRDVPRVGRITASLGIASFPDNGTTREELVARADEALYVAKRGGRDRVAHARDVAES